MRQNLANKFGFVCCALVLGTGAWAITPQGGQSLSKEVQSSPKAHHSQGAKGQKVWNLSADSHIGFEVKKFGVKNVEGSFKRASGRLTLQGGEQGLEIVGLSGRVEVGSVFTGSEKRDRHLLEADFLDSALAPYIDFSLERVEVSAREGDTSAGRLFGTLRLHGASRQISLDYELRGRELKMSGVINIKDFGIKGSMMNSNEVRLLIVSVWE